MVDFICKEMIMLRKKETFSNKKAQSTVEYLLLVAVVIVFVLIFNKTQGGIFSTALNRTMEVNINSMVNMSDRIFGL